MRSAVPVSRVETRLPLSGPATAVGAVKRPNFKVLIANHLGGRQTVPREADVSETGSETAVSRTKREDVGPLAGRSGFTPAFTASEVDLPPSVFSKGVEPLHSPNCVTFLRDVVSVHPFVIQADFGSKDVTAVSVPVTAHSEKAMPNLVCELTAVSQITDVLVPEKR